MFAFLFFNGYIFLNAGFWIIRTDEAPKSDVGIILMGRLVDRTLLAHSLLKQGRISRIVMVNDVVFDRNILDSIGFRVPTHATVSRELLLALGVADSLITIIPGDASSTCQEAGIFVKFLKSNPQIHKLAIITSSYHTRRSWNIFKDMLSDHKLNVRLSVPRNPYTGFNARHWYKKREDAKVVFQEYTKLLFFFLFEKW